MAKSSATQTEYDDVEILSGDSRDILPQLEAQSVQCCVTSSPYWGLRDYDHSAQNCWGLKDRDLMGLPWRVAFALQAEGWLLRPEITWVKKAPMPESVRNRPSNATEEVFLFSKTPNYYYGHQAVRGETGANLRNYWLLGSDSSPDIAPVRLS